MEFLYRFRPTSALLDARHELQNQEIYFASPEQLNDPMEGFKDIFWQGDRILWRNLLRHYLLCLMQSIALVFIAGSEYDSKMSENLVFWSESNLPTPQLRDKFRRICQSFFSNTNAAQIPILLEQLGHSVRREELAFYLNALHPRALYCVIGTLQEEKLLPQSNLPCPPEGALEVQPVVEMLRLQQARRPDSDDREKNFTVRAFAVAGQIQKQAEMLIRLQAREMANPAWQTICTSFPTDYIKQLSNLIYSKWYAACFVADPTHAAMWGNYGGGHQGVCLKFRANVRADGVSYLKLRRIVGWGSGPCGATTTYGDVDHPFRRICYTNRFDEVDFFRSIG